MVKVMILTSNEFYMDWIMCLMITIYSHIQMKLVSKVIALEGYFLWRNGQSIKRRYKLDEIVKIESIGDLIVTQACTKLYVIQGLRVGIRDSVSRD